MGKTYRYDSDCGEMSGKKSHRKLKTAPETIGVPDFAKAKYEPMDEVTALRSVEKRISYKLDCLIERGILNPCDKDFYESYVGDFVRRAASKYDPDHRNAEGKTSTAVHYFMVCVDNVMKTVTRHLTQKKRCAVCVPIVNDSVENAHAAGYVSTEELRAPDRNVRDADFRMDVETMRSMLTDIERRVLDLRLAGFTFDEIAEKLGCVRSTLTRRYMPRIQQVARECGFIPQSEIRQMERSKKTT